MPLKKGERGGFLMNWYNIKNRIFLLETEDTLLSYTKGLLFLCIFVFALSCMSKETSKEIYFTEIFKAPPYSTTGPAKADIKAFNDELSWSSFWQELGTTYKIPVIDFTRYTALAICLGEKPKNGYRIEITKVELKKNILKIYYNAIEPNDDCITVQILTYPIYIVQFEKIDFTETYSLPNKIISCN